MGDVGDLAKLVQAASGVRNASDLESKLRHELADCLWSVLVLAEQLNVRIEEAFASTMDELEAQMTHRLEAEQPPARDQ